MKFSLDESQLMLRDSVRRFVERDYAFSADLGHSPQTWEFFAEQGWLMAGAPEEAGGLGGDLFDSCVIAEELGRGLVREAYVPYAVMSATLLARLEPAGARLEGLLSGAARPVLAHNEAAARGDLGWVATTARPDGDGFVLEGEKTAILGGPAASSYLVSCRIPGEPDVALFEVQPGAAGLQVQDFRTVDNRGATNLRLAGVRVGAQARIGTAAQAAAALGAALDHGLVAACAETCGAMQAALKITREYLNTRKQFGVPIGDFQALRHKLADMFIETEQARSIVLRAIAAQNGSDAAEATRLASAAKARVGKAGHFVGAQAIQLHGGIGVTEEYSIGQYYKRFVMFDLWMGSSASHLDRFRRLGAEAA